VKIESNHPLVVVVIRFDLHDLIQFLQYQASMRQSCNKYPINLMVKDNTRFALDFATFYAGNLMLFFAKSLV
jgi:thiamine monophosphate synthase